MQLSLLHLSVSSDESYPGKLRAAMKELGFADVFEVAIGADLCAKQEAEDFLKEVPDELPFMATSCCPAWSVMAKKLFPDHANCISMALTPMTLTARLIKKHNPNAKVVFIEYVRLKNSKQCAAASAVK